MSQELEERVDKLARQLADTFSGVQWHRLTDRLRERAREIAWDFVNMEEALKKKQVAPGVESHKVRQVTPLGAENICAVCYHRMDVENPSATDLRGRVVALHALRAALRADNTELALAVLDMNFEDWLDRPLKEVI